jgi:hypothetical protein
VGQVSSQGPFLAAHQYWRHLFKPSCRLPPSAVFATLTVMLKKTLPFLLLALLAGCATQVTNLTPRQQTRNSNNLYPVEVAFSSKQQNVRWETVKPTVIVNGQPFEMHPILMMTNRWEGLVPVPMGTDAVQYRYRFDFDVNGFGKRSAQNAVSPTYNLKIVPLQ